MRKQRIIETNEGIQDKITVEIFDNFARIMRDKGWNNVDSFIKAGITKGNVLEIGPGPGYVGLEWLKRFPDAALTGCEISREMIRLAEKNARDYGFEKRTDYVEGNCMQIPFSESSFDAVFSNGSLHEWEDPVKVFNEIDRVLKPQGLFCITDMRRDVNPLIKWFIYSSTRPKEIRPGFLTSFNASYTVDEITNLLSQSKLKNTAVSWEFFGLCIARKKAAL
ncbi:class I SAM-dependent methyltransferase [Lacrimispora sp.]|uniref:class I SAM-dependent methyltransferase n=1 Tax=Lacrimispora sp. TaxID=2719234 RepID=UPI002896A7C6|nr:methyltransferase domain-containing protein [Lacrimispora sp.]